MDLLERSQCHEPQKDIRSKADINRLYNEHFHNIHKED